MQHSTSVLKSTSRDARGTLYDIENYVKPGVLKVRFPFKDYDAMILISKKICFKIYDPYRVG